MADEYGNLIDSRYESEKGLTPEYVELYCSPADSYLWDGADYTLNYAKVYVDNSGSASINYKVSKTPGTNIMTIKFPSPIDSQYRHIEGIADAVPFEIIAGITPNNAETPYLPADDESIFYITYYLIDRYGNPAGNREIYIFSSNSHDTPFYRTSNEDGQVMISYGPTPQKSVITLTAYSVDNESVRIETRFMFDSTEPVDMLLTANPEVMPSHDVAPDRTSAIRAKVIDERGNPVAEETVEFSIEPGSYPAYHTANPLLSAASAITDENGQAIVYFTPGSFIFNTNDDLYEELSSANCTVKAKWGETERGILLEWKNFPYLSVESEVNPETVEVNSTVDVTIRLIGDGWALQPDPIDVMLSADRSGSMLKDYPDRMVTVMDAMKEFVSAMSEGRDRIGLTTFGKKDTADIWKYGYFYWAGLDYKSYSITKEDIVYITNNYPNNGTYYMDYATLDLSLTTDHSTIGSEIDNIVPMDATPMRKGIYLAIKELVDKPNANSDAVRAVIVLSDGDYNYYGDPLARGSGSTYYGASSYDTLTKNYYYFSGIPSSQQNMAEYAKANNIIIYTIGFGSDLSSGGIYTLQQLAEQTGGKYYAADSANINDVYREIAGDLKTEAGVNTQMDLDFSNIELNNVSVPNPPAGSDAVLRYVFLDDVSTVVEKWNKTDTVIPRHTIDDTNDWSEDSSLSFDVGTVKLSETWETTFRLKVLKGGNINIFGPGSTITFNNGTDSLTLPKTYVTAVENLTATGINFKDLYVLDLHSTNTGKITDTLDIKWNLTYTGEHTAEQKVFYMRTSDNVWIQFQTVPSGPGNSTNDAQLVVRDLPPGSYTIRVHAKSPDTADSIAQLSHPVIIGDSSATYIKIE